MNADVLTMVPLDELYYDCRLISKRKQSDPWEMPSRPTQCARLSTLLECDRMSLLALHVINDGYDDRELVHYSVGKRGRSHGINDIFIPGVGTYRNIEHKVFFRGLKRGGRG